MRGARCSGRGRRMAAPARAERRTSTGRLLRTRRYRRGNIRCSTRTPEPGPGTGSRGAASASSKAGRSNSGRTLVTPEQNHLAIELGAADDIAAKNFGPAVREPSQHHGVAGPCLPHGSPDDIATHLTVESLWPFGKTDAEVQRA